MNTIPTTTRLGSHDMAGNVRNWTTTFITARTGAEAGKTVNEVRSGSWYATGNSCRSTCIGEGRAGSGNYDTVRFRIVLIPSTRSPGTDEPNP
jgi:formylglycine-generating enzyme required for sulfatase activity